MKANPPDGRTPGVMAYAWASRITTVSLEMVLPGVGGYWLDQRLGTLPALTLVGFSLGLIGGIWHLIRMTSPDHGRTGGTNRLKPPTSSPNDNGGPHSHV